MSRLFLGARSDSAPVDAMADGAVRLRTEDLTTHGVIVGMTGSGKTGLGVVLIEEVLRAGLPVLAIDPKGDLTNLCLGFPDLAPADFRPWIDEAQARTAGVTPDEFADRQAELWRTGLAGWGLDGASIAELRAAADVTVYTPGSRSGVPIDLVGSLDVPAGMADGSLDEESIAGEIDGFVAGLLGLVGIAADPLSSREHILLANIIHHSWSEGRDLDLATLVGMVQQPPIRKLGVFELDQFFPASDRTALALRLNGLLASPSFAAWATGQHLDIDALLRTPDGRPRCAVITTAHLSDDERQFVTSLLLGKLITWMRRQSGTTDLRALLYMDEVHGYLPPTANPPTKTPIMTLMKTARAFGLGVVLSTQNPVDIDYKAVSNAGTWMIGRLQTERDKARLLDGMSAATGGVDLQVLGDTIAGLDRRQFVLRQASSDTPITFSTRWAMSYLRGPMTRDQIASLIASTAMGTSADDASPASPSPTTASPAGPTAAPTGLASTGGGTAGESVSGAIGDGVDGFVATPSDPTATTVSASRPLGADESPVMPEVATGIPVRWVDIASPWLRDVGGDSRGTRLSPALVARVHLRYKQTRADLTHDEEYEAVLHPVGAIADARQCIAVDYDDRDLRTDAPADAVYRLTDAPLRRSAFFTGFQRDLVDHIQRSMTLEIPANEKLKLYGRAGETAEEFATRCRHAAAERADADVAKLRSRFETRATKLRDQIASAEERAVIAAETARGQRNSELFSTASTMLGGILGGRRSRGGALGSVLGSTGTAAGRRSRTTASKERARSAENRVERLLDELDRLEEELEREVATISASWDTAAAEVTTIEVTLTKTNITVTDLALAWLPVG